MLGKHVKVLIYLWFVDVCESDWYGTLSVSLLGMEIQPIQDSSKPLELEEVFASSINTCIYPRDGICDDPSIYPRDSVCDDPRGTKYCALGTDCQDCGPA